MVRDLLSPASIRRRGWFSPDYVERLLSEHEAGFTSHALPIWGLVSLELWQRLFCDSDLRATGPLRHAPAPHGLHHATENLMPTA
jgi:asparagine synthase (glutamine-hydrolysing)